MENWWIWLILIGVMVVFFIFSARSNKKRQEQTVALRKSIAVDTEIKTIGGIIGKVVAIDETAGTITVETGNSTMVFDAEAVYPLAAYGRNGEKVDLDALLKEANENPAEGESTEEKTSEETSTQGDILEGTVDENSDKKDGDLF